MAVRPAASRKSARKKQQPHKQHQPQYLESLENRALFSVISVTDFGAIPNDGKDDSSSIQRALDASDSNDTIVFSGGTFDLKTAMKAWPSDRTYKGQNDATLKGKTSKGQLLSFRGDDITISGLTFDGGGLFFDRGTGFNQNINIDNNVFKLNTSGENPGGITFTSGLKHADITNNYFTGYGGSGFGIYGYNYNDLIISNNEFVNVTAGMHIDAFANSANLLVEQNYITGAKGMGMEFQSSATNLVFQDNWFEHPNLSADKKRNNNSMAFSLILDKSSNISIRRNVVLAPERPDGIGCRIAFEVGGDNTVVEDNYVDGVNHVLAVNDGVGTCSVVAKNNVFKNILQGANISFPSSNPKRTFQQSNNGPGTDLTWNLSRGTPGRNHRYGDASKPAPQPTPEPTPDPTPTPEPAPVPTPDPTPDPAPDPTPTPDPVTQPDNSTDTPTENTMPPVDVELPPSLPVTVPVSMPDPTPVSLPDPIPQPTPPEEPAPTQPEEPAPPQQPAPTEKPTTPSVPTIPDEVLETPAPTQTPPVVNTPAPVSAPAAPSRLAGKAASTSRIDLSWADNSNGESGFLIERSFDATNWGQIGKVAANVTKFSDNGLPYSAKVYYRVRAYNTGGQSDYSISATATTLGLNTPTTLKSVKPPSIGLFGGFAGV